MELTAIKGIGPKKREIFQKQNILSVNDLLEMLPRSYEDRTRRVTTGQAVDGENAYLELEIISTPRLFYPRKGLSLVRVAAQDEDGRCTITWFNNRFVARRLKQNTRYKFFGRIRKDNGLQLINPVFEDIGGKEIGGIVPIYSAIAGLSDKEVRKFVAEGFRLLQGKIPDVLPDRERADFRILHREEALRTIHFPTSAEKLEQAKKSLAYEEFFVLRTAMELIKKKNGSERGIPLPAGELLSQAREKLPFRLTEAQARVSEELTRDLESSRPTNRLIQGDVGSGKTVVAVLAMIQAFGAGYQSAFMVPTEILAGQHYNGYRKFLQENGLHVAMLTSGISKKERREILDGLADGTVDAVFGTHALIQKDVLFSNLGLVITDEQHRFGVAQRGELWGKGAAPNTVVMTATPIPRTLALILYGDLNISSIDQLPPGRKPVATYAVPLRMEKRLSGFVKKQVNAGKQAYIVCPLVEESEVLQAQSVVGLYERLVREYYGDCRVGYLHGRMKSEEKERIMQAFRNNEIQILISTTVVEVGMDVKNATVMVVYNAERFGLAQLHQLRGRVGRGDDQATCILVVEKVGPETTLRMRTMETTDDGFEIAEKDLELRGAGDFLGTRQHGVPALDIARLYANPEALEKVDRRVEALFADGTILSPAYRSLYDKAEQLTERPEDVVLN